MQFVLRAFQLHWRPERVDMCLDVSSLETARRLALLDICDSR